MNFAVVHEWRGHDWGPSISSILLLLILSSNRVETSFAANHSIRYPLFPGEYGAQVLPPQNNMYAAYILAGIQLHDGIAGVSCVMGLLGSYEWSSFKVLYSLQELGRL